MSFELVGIRLIAENAAAYFGDMAKGDKATDAFSASTAVAAKQVNFFDDSLRKIKIDKLTNDLNQQQKALNILQQELTQTTAKYGEGSIQAQKKALAVDKLSDAIGITEKKIEAENTTLAREKAAFDASAHAAEAAVPAIDKLGNETKQAGDNAEKSAPQWKGLSEIAIGALRHIGEIAVDVFRQAGAAAIGFFKDSIGVAGDFESGMNRFAAVAGGALEESGLALKDFRDQFIQIGKELPVSTSEVQDAAIEMVKGGIEPATIAAGGLKQVIQFAAAADLDLEAASTIAAKALGGWIDQAATADEKAQFLAHSTDLLAKAANASTVDVKDLALGLYNVQGTAKSFGVNFDEVVTTLAEVAPGFASSAEAGTSFASFIKSLQPKTAPAKAAMMDLGLWTKETGSAFYDAQGQFVGMEKASELLSTALGGLSDAQKAAILPQIFGDGLRVASTLAEKGSAGFDAMAASMAKQSSVADMAKQKQAGFNTALDNFKGSVEALQITIGSVLLPVLTDLFNNYLAPGINLFTDLADDLFAVDGGFGVMADDIRELTGIDIMPLFNSVQIGIGYVQELIAVFQSTGEESSALGGVLDQLAGVWNTLIQTINDVATGYEMVIDAVLPLVSDLIGEHGDEIMGFFEDTFDTIIEIVTIALKLYDGIVTGVMIVVSEFIKEHGETIKNIFTNVWTIIKNVITATLEIIKGILKAALQVFQGDWKGAWDTIRTMSENVVKALWEIIKAGLDLIANLFGTTLSDIGATWSHNWDAFKAQVSLNIDNLVKLFTGLPDQVAGVGEAVMNSIWDGMKAVWQDIMNWLNDKLQEFQDMLPGSEPKDPSSPLRGLPKRGAAIFDMIGEGMRRANPLPTAGLAAPVASPMLAGLRGGASSITNNQQRTASITYNTAVAPPMSQSYAMAQALVGGF